MSTANGALLVFHVRGSMSKESRKFAVPNELADLYDFANSLDLRHFTHHGVAHVPGDALGSPQALGAWMSARGLMRPGAKATSAMLETALALRSGIRAYLECDATARQCNKKVLASLNK